MIGYLCATPLHIITAITMQSGMFSDKHSTLIVMNHFDVDDKFIERIKETKVFDEVLLFDSNNKTKVNKIKRLVNSVFPAKLIKNIANNTNYSHFVSFALDFINLSYIVKRYKKRNISCKFAFGDDGIGTYMNDGLYKPKKLAQNILKAVGRASYLKDVQSVYVYKPQYMVDNLQYEICKIKQNEETCKKRKDAVCKIWPLNETIEIDNVILSFEQPNILDVEGKDRELERAILRKTAKRLNAPVVIKMHPRSLLEKEWSEFSVITTKMPFEAIMLQKQCVPKLMMTVNSTALFSAYLFDDLSATECPSILLYRLMKYQREGSNKSMDKLCKALSANEESSKIYNPSSIEELENYLKI